MPKFKKAGKAIVAKQFNDQATSKALQIEFHGSLASLLDKEETNMA